MSMVSTPAGVATDLGGQCVCQQGENGEGLCICDVPCDFVCGKEKMMEWVCECNLGGNTCQCKFQVQCRKSGEERPCGERKVYVCRCKFRGGDCLFQINKCACCDIVRSECGVCRGESKTGVSEGQAKVMLLEETECQ